MLTTVRNGQTNTYDAAEAKSLERRAWELINRGETKRAFSVCEKLNRRFPDFGSGWHTASLLMMRLENPQAALAAVERALSIDPGQPAWLLQRASCLARLGRITELQTAVQNLPTHTMKTAYQYSTLAMLETQLGLREKAVERYEKAMELEPGDARHHYNAACLQRSLGDLDSAEKNFDAAIRLNPADYESYKIRSDLRQQTPDRNHVAALKRLLDGNIENGRDRVQLLFALAKELEDLGESEQSFKHLENGSRIRRKMMNYDVERDLETIDTIKGTFSSDVFAEPTEGSENAEPIFILGMPRTGTTLVERILASHTDVFAAGELNNFAAQLMSMMREHHAGKRMPRDEMVKSSALLDFKQLGESYVASTRPFTGETPRFIDKMPLNYLYVGLIHLALPKAKIINLQRDPMDTCYAVYKQLFVDAYPFSYDLDELARYYVAYTQLMQHWNDELPGVIHTVSYEQLVSDFHNETRALLDACELDWQPQCLKFHENKEASTTASTAQIRQPVYKSSTGKWRSYEKQLQTVAQILEQAGISPTDT